MPVTINVLLIGEDREENNLIAELLRESRRQEFILSIARNLTSGLKSLESGKFDIILLEIGESRQNGLEALQELYCKYPEIPILILTDVQDDFLGLKVIQEGAQDYLGKDQLNCQLLARSISYAIERHSLVEALRSMALLDELTGLYNRRGFMSLAAQQILLANRSKRGFILLYMDLDDLKRTNDRFGHLAGDFALKEVAGILKAGFRVSDIIARMGGDEFVVVNLNAGKEEAENLLKRLERELAEHNRERSFPLQLSVGTVAYDPQNPLTLDTLLSQADQAMYREKARKRAASAKSGQ